MKKSVFLLLAVVNLFALPCLVTGQSLDFLSLRLMPEANIPLAGSRDLYTTGGGVSFALDLDILPFVTPTVEAGYGRFPTLAGSDLSAASIGTGFVWNYYPIPRMGLSLGATGGLFQADYDNTTASNFFAKGRLGLNYRFSPSFALAAAASWSRFSGPENALYQGLGVGLSGTLSLSGLRGGTNVEVRNVKFDPIFPIFYSHYDTNRLGVLSLENKEAGDIRNVRVSFFIKQFMDQPKVCAEYPVIKRGQSVEVPVYALLTDQVLKLTESVGTAAEIIVDYTFLDSSRQARIGETLRVNHRNALAWDDDRKAAAFVSAKDPAVLRYSKYAAGLIRETGQSEINQNLRFAMGLFEGLRLYGINYVIDPTTPYKELSLNTSALDFLQFPNQTLIYKGGDCDDLSILFCSILESVGIKTAFITIPGHIYMAFSLDTTEEAAKSAYSSTGDLIFIGGNAWLPVEITLVNDGFLKAWQIGAREWNDNAKNNLAALIPVHDAWNDFEPVGIPGEDTRIVLPQPEQIVSAYNTALAKFVAREIQPKVEAVKTDIIASGNQPKQVNRLGVLYARFGMYDQAKTEFEKAGKAGYAPALTNLGNIAFLQKNYPEAINHFQRALNQVKDSKTALLGLARAQFELENYPAAGSAYAQVQKTDPELAGQYPYLVSRTDGTARAASAAERTGRAAWNEE